MANYKQVRLQRDALQKEVERLRQQLAAMRTPTPKLERKVHLIRRERWTWCGLSNTRWNGRAHVGRDITMVTDRAATTCLKCIKWYEENNK